MKLSVILFAFFPFTFSTNLAASKESKDVKNKIMNFNYELDQFLDKIRYEKAELLEGQNGSTAEDALKFLNCISPSPEDGLLDSTRNVLTMAYKMIIKEELNTPVHKKFCQSSAKNVFNKLKNCTRSNKKSPFLHDINEIIIGTEKEICTPENLEYKLAVSERFREEIDSDNFKDAFKRYEELLKDCNKLKSEDHCLPWKLADAFDAEALESQVFSPPSRGFFKKIAHIYFTTAIKAPYKRSKDCYNKIDN
uniref:Uncharacterized protein n=1 Tax=Panagrolaimus sp. PS1159 TaxID=55785 RepID=A0AC35GVA3_9BILA